MKKTYQKPEVMMLSLQIEGTIADSIMDGSMGTGENIFGDEDFGE